MQKLLRLFRPVDISSLAFLRIALGICFAFHIGEHALGSSKYLEIAAPSFSFHYPGFAWLPPITEGTMKVLLDVMLLSTIGITLGVAYRASCLIFALGTGYLHFYDAALFLNHYYLVFLLSLLMFFVPANGAFSLDAWLRPRLRRSTTPLWTIWVLRFQVGIPFLFSGLSKLNGDWLSGVTTLYHWRAFVAGYPWAEALPSETMALLIAWCGVFADLTVFPLMLWRRTRLLGFSLAVLFNLGNAFLFSGASFKIHMFPWIMLAGVTVFLDPDWPRQFWGRLRGMKTPTEPDSSSSAHAEVRPNGVKILTLGLLGGYVLIQLGLPLRNYFYPGDNRWSEAARTHSWRMMEFIKVAETTYVVTDPATGETWTRSPFGAVSGRRYARFQSNPGLIWQYAMHIKQQMAEQGHPDCEVRVESFATLNGRPSQRLIDPSVDITTAPARLGYFSWVLPLEEPRPSLSQLVERFSRQKAFREASSEREQ